MCVGWEVRGLFDAQHSADDEAFVCLLHISGQERVVDDTLSGVK